MENYELITNYLTVIAIGIGIIVMIICALAIIKQTWFDEPKKESK
jgi:hypothetical protein